MTGVSNVWLKPSSQEWLETDGLGGFASSTTLGIHTRRYHGWLFLAGNEPGERWLALSKIEDTCTGPDGKWELSSNLYPGSTHPDGIRHLWGFSRDPFPRFTFKIGKNILQREVFMIKGMPGVFCTYRLQEVNGVSGRKSLTLNLRPLCNSRFYHYTAREGSWNPKIFSRENAVVIETHSAGGNLALICTGSSFTKEAKWYKNMLYPVERQRGLDYVEDHFSPGYFTCQIKQGEEVVFWTGPISGKGEVITPNLAENMGFSQLCQGLQHHASKWRTYEMNRRRIIKESANGNRLLADLCFAADQFVVKSETGTSIIAGYHWFGEWGRDTFISLPGLLLNTGRFSEAREVFGRFAVHIQDGIVPNCLIEGEGAAYNSVDASLWFIDALAKYEKITGDWQFVKTLLQKVGEIINAYITGTKSGIKMDSSGLLAAGSYNSQLTWMDARVNGIPVTPRYGFPVEVNALWIRALSLFGNWLSRLNVEGVSCKSRDIRYVDGTRHRLYSRLALKASREFKRLFIWPGVGLYDRIDDKGPVPEIRPNQIIAGSISDVTLPRQVLVEVFNTAYGKLLSPHGIRTLAPFSTGYQGKYAGDPKKRDSAYHQGTAWPWLFGPLFDLYVRLLETKHRTFVDNRVNPSKTSADSRIYKPKDHLVARSGLKDVTQLLLSHILRLDRNMCVGTIFEVASGDSPFEAGGTVSQAWSVSEAIRILSFFNDSTPKKKSAG